jgi:hypothetical protein
VDSGRQLCGNSGHSPTSWRTGASGRLVRRSVGNPSRSPRHSQLNRVYRLVSHALPDRHYWKTSARPLSHSRELPALASDGQNLAVQINGLARDSFDGTEPTRGPRFRLGRRIVPSRSKQNCLHTLGFIPPIRDFSTGCDAKKQENSLSFLFAAGCLPRRGFNPAIG